MANLMAEWIFSETNVVEGSIIEDKMILCDTTGNGNDLEMKVFGDSSDSLKDNLKWVNYGDEQALRFKNSKYQKAGKYFSTIASAPVNGMRFENGYTIEVEIKLPADKKFDPWMGIVTRQGSGMQIGKTKGEKEILATLSFNDSFQWTWYPINEDENYTCWSCCADDLILNDFIHVSVRNNGEYTKMYLNGVTDIRNPKKELNGIELVEGMGWNIGAALWDNKIDSLFSGEIKAIRIFDGDSGRTKYTDAYQNNLFVLEGTNEPQQLRQNSNNEILAVLPDTQYMGQYQNEIVDKMVEWTVDNKETLGIAGMIHVGDLSEESKKAEFEIADKTFSYADKAEFDYLITPGNHDYRDNGINFGTFFGAKRYQHKKNVMFCSDALASAMSIVISKREYLLLSLDSYKMDESVKWAKKILENNTLPVILFTHDIYILNGKNLVRTENGERIWSELINCYDEIFLTIGGHHFGVGHNIEKNVNGKEVIELLINYQAYPNGGNGWLQLLEFDENNNRISITTYSPWVDSQKEKDCYDYSYLISDNDKFCMPVKFEERLN